MNSTNTITPIGMMEPLMPSEGDNEIDDLAFELIREAFLLNSQTSPIILGSIGDLVRSMNCYYSNLIEGHNTHPREIDKALKKNYSTNPEKRALQLEAKAHIEVQRLIDTDKLIEDVSSKEYIKKLHFEFCSRLPPELLVVSSPNKQVVKNIIPGEFRDSDVQIGEHIPPEAKSLDSFMSRFHEKYDPKKLSKIRQIVAVASSYHRLLWIHPFYDGNGRVARLHSHAYLRIVGIGSSLWSISRGLARNSTEYKERLSNADQRRLDDFDGRGSLTHKGLSEFVKFFLKICVDQVTYMTSVLEVTNLSQRINSYLINQTDLNKFVHPAYLLLREILINGEVERGRVPIITGYAERQARALTSKLHKMELIECENKQSPWRINFPLKVLEHWFPRLYPEDLVF